MIILAILLWSGIGALTWVVGVETSTRRRLTIEDKVMFIGSVCIGPLATFAFAAATIVSRKDIR